MAWKNWGDHPFVVTVGVLASLAGIIAPGFTINEVFSSPEIPKFQGEIGNFKASESFVDFIFENQGNIVLLDVESFENLSRQPETGFAIDYFHLWDNCFEPLAPNEEPWGTKCTGTGFSIDQSVPLSSFRPPTTTHA